MKLIKCDKCEKEMTSNEFASHGISMKRQETRQDIRWASTSGDYLLTTEDYEYDFCSKECLSEWLK